MVFIIYFKPIEEIEQNSSLGMKSYFKKSLHIHVYYVASVIKNNLEVLQFLFWIFDTTYESQPRTTLEYKWACILDLSHQEHLIWNTYKPENNQ